MIKCRCGEINKFLGGEGEDYAREHLKKIAIDETRGIVLYSCPQTGRFWKKFFPHPEAHGDGPPDYIQISEAEAKKEFKF